MWHVGLTSYTVFFLRSGLFMLAPPPITNGSQFKRAGCWKMPRFERELRLHWEFYT